MFFGRQAFNTASVSSCAGPSQEYGVNSKSWNLPTLEIIGKTEQKTERETDEKTVNSAAETCRKTSRPEHYSGSYLKHIRSSQSSAKLYMKLASYREYLSGLNKAIIKNKQRLEAYDKISFGYHIRELNLNKLGFEKKLAEIKINEICSRLKIRKEQEELFSLFSYFASYAGAKRFCSRNSASLQGVPEVIDNDMLGSVSVGKDTAHRDLIDPNTIGTETISRDTTARDTIDSVVSRQYDNRIIYLDRIRGKYQKKDASGLSSDLNSSGLNVSDNISNNISDVVASFIGYRNLNNRKSLERLVSEYNSISDKEHHNGAYHIGCACHVEDAYNIGGACCVEGAYHVSSVTDAIELLRVGMANGHYINRYDNNIAPDEMKDEIVREYCLNKDDSLSKIASEISRKYSMNISQKTIRKYARKALGDPELSRRGEHSKELYARFIC
ncbi:hypothetical protein JXB31_04485 [Candidatus Woesearchaeota archaeon]|nr:hypothetical protein [Candidatus Woesearchaeota archaeon]